jgi:hypothetical protein
MMVLAVRLVVPEAHVLAGRRLTCWPAGSGSCDLADLIIIVGGTRRSPRHPGGPTDNKYVPPNRQRVSVGPGWRSPMARPIGPEV